MLVAPAVLAAVRFIAAFLLCGAMSVAPGAAAFWLVSQTAYTFAWRARNLLPLHGRWLCYFVAGLLVAALLPLLGIFSLALFRLLATAILTN